VLRTPMHGWTKRDSPVIEEETLANAKKNLDAWKDEKRLTGTSGKSV